MHRFSLTALLTLALLALTASQATAVETISSPSGNITVNLDVRDGKAFYDVAFKGKRGY